MNSSTLLILPPAVALLWGCSPSPAHTPTSTDTSVQGSWELVAYIPNKRAEWTSYGDSILYQKHLTSTHFMWFHYDKHNEQIVGMGGGSYQQVDDTYIENITFFYPPGSSELGQSITFDCQIEKDLWLHTGFAVQMEMDLDNGQMIVVDSNKIQEKWVRTKAPINGNLGLAGTWDLIAYRDSSSAAYTEYPDFVGYMKLITPTHFTWFYYDKEGDEIYASGAGTYTYDGQTYIEQLSMIHPNVNGVLGEKLVFQSTLQDNNWLHVGYLPVIAMDSTNGDIRRYQRLIDEKWVMHEETVIDGMIF